MATYLKGRNPLSLDNGLEEIQEEVAEAVLVQSQSAFAGQWFGRIWKKLPNAQRMNCRNPLSLDNGLEDNIYSNWCDYGNITSQSAFAGQWFGSHCFIFS